jgi:hypothetical protein
VLIISTVKTESGIHSIEDHLWMSAEQIPNGFTRVPEHMQKDAMKSLGWCDLEFDGGGALIGITPLAKPEASETELRREAYQTEPVVSWGGETITVDEANFLWMAYSAEASPLAGAISAEITAAKQTIRRRREPAE